MTATKSTRTTDTGTLSAEERAAMKERAAEVRKAAGRGTNKAEKDAKDCVDKIAEMPDADRVLAERIHALVTENAPELAPKTWYGMPAYARDGAVVCFFQAAAKFNARYATFGFNDSAALDQGTVWPTTFAVTKLGEQDERFLAELIRRAVS